MKTARLVLIALFTALLTGCGIKGALYLPAQPKAKPVPAQSAPAADLSKPAAKS